MITLAGLVAAVALAPLFWLCVPAAWRREVVSVGSLVALAAYDARLPVLLIAVGFGVSASVRVAGALGQRARALFVAFCLLALVALFVWNKSAGGGYIALPTQSGLVFVGVSFLVLKAAAVLIEAGRGNVSPSSGRAILAWLAFLPTYPSGPIEDLDHFSAQWPRFDHRRLFRGLERILFGLVKSLVLANVLGEWLDPILAAPEAFGSFRLFLGFYAVALRFYFDLAGASDIAIGLGALFGYEIEENFDRPFARRNLVQLWQHWHMTLTRWFRTYVFTPVSRALMRRGSGRFDRLAIAAGQLVTMTLIGVWHNLTWNFFVFGLLQGVGFIWVGLLARDAGRFLPASMVRWWRRTRPGYVVSTALTLSFFSISCIFSAADMSHALRYLRATFRP